MLLGCKSLGRTKNYTISVDELSFICAGRNRPTHWEYLFNVELNLLHSNTTYALVDCAKRLVIVGLMLSSVER